MTALSIVGVIAGMLIVMAPFAPSVVALLCNRGDSEGLAILGLLGSLITVVPGLTVVGMALAVAS